MTECSTIHNDGPATEKLRGPKPTVLVFGRPILSISPVSSTAARRPIIMVFSISNAVCCKQPSISCGLTSREVQALSDPYSQPTCLCVGNFMLSRKLSNLAVRVQQGAHRKVPVARRLVMSSISSRDSVMP